MSNLTEDTKAAKECRIMKWQRTINPTCDDLAASAAMRLANLPCRPAKKRNIALCTEEKMLLANPMNTNQRLCS